MKTELNKARQMVEFNGLGHSAAIHTADEELTKEFGKAVKAIRVICNSPSTSVVSGTFIMPSCHH